MKTLDCVILAYEGPILRAYLSVLSALGYRAKAVVKLFNGKRRLRYFPSKMRHALLFNREALANNYWPISFSKKRDFKENVCAPILTHYNLSSDFFDLFGKLSVDYQCIADDVVYCDCEDKGWKSEKLYELLKSLGSQTYLFTGGGLVPNAILALPSTEFFHVHPGFLPYTRGADGILWSTLIRQKPGASCFYMVPQLDEGHLILAEEYEPLTFRVNGPLDDSTRYRLIYSFYDPAVRALCLKHVLEKYGSLSHLPTTEQALDKGITYHFMHERLKAKVLKEIIC